MQAKQGEYSTSPLLYKLLLQRSKGMTGFTNRPERVVHLVSLGIRVETSSLLCGGTAVGPGVLRARRDVNACSGDNGSESARGEGVVPNGETFPAPNGGLSKMGLGEG
ncbi:hypothetical protein QYM36_018476 [Artemia franciscana]|uniref:Uncharacterized protein n=1 Tax=Artemia franciscana TaxID=6661 RepID=A0AA88HCC2_ARTSF|nr:hypothetical protein QYM36_018476 [Artemia franciscana]